jgi:hypothetical protein
MISVHFFFFSRGKANVLEMFWQLGMQHRS